MSFRILELGDTSSRMSEKSKVRQVLRALEY